MTPTTVSEVLDVVLGHEIRQGSKGWDRATPTRYAHLTELLQQGVPPEVVAAAEQRISASGWLKKPAREVTDADLEQLRQQRPWEAA
jgi:hypothetical protein